ncbi:hypothetical protein [Nonomuraea salmonea]|uniref:DUF4123 domain-containing protein n=1 Tax=Nonomuraea salmonea TaxID=46181 RepID=A0ABV5P481_9ACTN
MPRYDAALRAALSGPPAAFLLDAERYELTGSWACLWEHMQAADPDWRMPLLWDLLHPEDADALEDRLADPGDELRLRDVYPVASRLVEQATGRAWWVAQRLIVAAVAGWPELDGALLLRSGVDVAGLMERSPARACSVIYAWLIDGAQRKEVAKFDAKLKAPPLTADLDAEPLWTPHDEGDAFMAAMAAQRGRRG